jgi:hypothetical protein
MARSNTTDHRIQSREHHAFAGFVAVFTLFTCGFIVEIIYAYLSPLPYKNRTDERVTSQRTRSTSATNNSRKTSWVKSVDVVEGVGCRLRNTQ